MAQTKKRADGRYQRNIYIGTENGKKIYKTVYGKSEPEVNKKAREIRNQLDKGIDVIEAKTPFKDCVAKWLKHLKTSDSQYNLYKYRISVFTDALGNQSINKIKPVDLQSVIDDVAINNPTTNKPSSKKTVSNYIVTVKKLYQFLTSNRYIEFDSAEALTVPAQAEKKKERRALTSIEQQWVKEFKHRAQLPAMIAMLCGLRRGEISALQWGDIDLDSKTINVSKSFDFKNNQIKEPKTEAGFRVVPMPDELVKFLKPYKQKKTALVVTNKDGNPMTEPAWQRLFTYYMNALNRTYGDLKGWKPTRHQKKPPMTIEPFTMHELRHTYATILYSADVDVITAKELLGHSDIQTTMGIYTHLADEKKQHSIDKLNDFLNKNSQENSQKFEKH